MKQRSERRRQRMVFGISRTCDEAEQWDLAYWQSVTPAERLRAHAAILEDVARVEEAKRSAESAGGKPSVE